MTGTASLRHRTYDPTNPAHRIADDALRMASGAFPANVKDLVGIANDIGEVLTERASLLAALQQIADGSTPPSRNGHYLAHRAAVKIARDALKSAMPL